MAAEFRSLPSKHLTVQRLLTALRTSQEYTKESEYRRILVYKPTFSLIRSVVFWVVDY